jgi:pimeloyl-ACP methyl ester carboxylesterase/DNA-binding CsgD family transcriptional regulator
VISLKTREASTGAACHDPQIRYATTRDGLKLAFWTRGSGRPFVHLTLGTTALQGEFEIPELSRWYGGLAENTQLVRFNNRGEGLSDRPRGGRTLDAALADLEAVMDTLRLEKVVLFAPWYGGPPAIRYAALHPERVSHLVLWCTFARGREWLNQPQFQAVRSLADKDWTAYSEAVAHVMFGWSRGDVANRHAAILRESVTPEFIHDFYADVGQWDASAYLPKITMPTLVMQREQQALGVEVAREMASAIPDARLAVLPGESLAPYLENADGVTQMIREFVEETSASPSTRASGLTEREVEILRMVAAGKSNRLIGEELVISINTVDRHVSNILTKISASNRAEAACYAVRHALA